MDVDVARGDGGHSEASGQLGEEAVAPPVVAGEGPLELDPEAIGAEGGEELRAHVGGGRVPAVLDAPRQGAVAGAARQAHAHVGVLDAAGETDRFGEERLMQALAGDASTPDARLERLTAALAAFQTGVQRDDIAVLAAQRTSSPGVGASAMGAVRVPS